MAEGPIPIGYCPRCAREVIAVVAAVAEAELERARVCAHCDGRLATGTLRWIAEADLDAVGYAAYAEADGCGRGGCTSGCGRG